MPGTTVTAAPPAVVTTTHAAPTRPRSTGRPATAAEGDAPPAPTSVPPSSGCSTALWACAT